MTKNDVVNVALAWQPMAMASCRADMAGLPQEPPSPPRLRVVYIMCAIESSYVA